MVAWAVEPITAGRAEDGWYDRLDHCKEGATQTSKIGAPIVLTAGVEAESGANPATFDGYSRVAGANRAGADTIDNFPYLRTVKGRRFRGTLVEAQNTVAVGTLVGVAKDGTTGIWQFSTAVANKVAKITKIDNRAAGADTNTIVEVESTIP
jgi:hypothetical protein